MCKGRRVGSTDHIRMMHASLHKIDKGDEILTTAAANEFPQLTVLHLISSHVSIYVYVVSLITNYSVS